MIKLAKVRGSTKAIHDEFEQAMKKIRPSFAIGGTKASKKLLDKVLPDPNLGQTRSSLKRTDNAEKKSKHIKFG